MARRRGLDATAGLRSLLLLLCFLDLASAFRFVPGSPCEPVCEEGTLTEDAVCLDSSYRDSENGTRIRDCVGCLLNSTAVDTANNQTDVEWGLFNLRYTLSSCMFGYPEERVSISSPCQVTCQPLNASVGFGITNDTSDADPGLDYCTAHRFDDTTINNCAFCYSFIPQQLFIANFMQALHIQCRQPAVPGQVFFPDANAIFNETLIAGPSPPSEGSGGGGLHGSALALAISLPIVGGILILGFGCWGCWIFTRRRRRRMQASGRMSKVHDAQADGGYSPVSPRRTWGADEPAREMSHLDARGKQPSPVVTRWSGQYPGGAPTGEDGTPLRSSFQRDDVGPGPGQTQDPDLHEQYFGIADGGPDVAGPSHYTDQRHSGQYAAGPSQTGQHVQEDERGYFVR